MPRFTLEILAYLALLVHHQMMKKIGNIKNDN